MLDSLTSSNYNDFRQRYEATFGFLEQGGKRTLVLLEKVDHQRCTFSDQNGNKYFANVDKGTVFSFIPIIRGLYNTPDGVVYLQRVPATQYKRGISKSNTSVARLEHGIFVPRPITFNLLSSVIGKQSYSKDVQEWEEGKIEDVAFSKQFAVSSSSVYFFNTRIGVYSKEDKTFYINSICLQEFTDCLKRLNLKEKVYAAD